MNAGLLGFVYETISHDPALTQSEQDVILAIAAELETPKKAEIAGVSRLSSRAKISERTFQRSVNGYTAKGTYLPGLVERSYLTFEDRGYSPTGKHFANRYGLGSRLLDALAENKGRYRLDQPATVAPSPQIHGDTVAADIDITNIGNMKTEKTYTYKNTTGDTVSPTPVTVQRAAIPEYMKEYADELAAKREDKRKRWEASMATEPKTADLLAQYPKVD